MYLPVPDDDIEDATGPFPSLHLPARVANDGVPSLSALDLHRIVHEELSLTLEVYAGEFTVHPCPLELSLNYCSHKCAFCCHVDQPVMLNSLRTIRSGDVKVGDELLGWVREDEPDMDVGTRPGRPHGHYRKWAKTTVTHTFRRKAPLQRVTLTNGESVICTPDHHWYTGRSGDLEYKPASMRKGRKMYRVDLPLTPHIAEPYDAYMIGYIRGAMEGDGCWMPQKAWRLAMKDREPLDRIIGYLEKMGFGRYSLTPYPAPGRDASYMDQLYFEPGSPVLAMINDVDKEDREYWRGWLAGIYDAEGNTPARLDRRTPESLRICQVKAANPLTYQRIERALRIAGFATVAEDRYVRVTGGRLEAARFCQYVQPAIERKKNPLLGSSLKGIEHPHRIVSIEQIGEGEVASFETTSHNYVSGGYMSRNCFSNLNSPSRRANVPSIMRLIADHQERQTPVAKLLQMRYPILFSNKVDPFALSNYQQSIPILETLTELGIPVAYQTRGGTGASAEALNEALEWLAPAVWYVSFNTLNDDLRRQLEPGTGTIEYRLELLTRLREAGHRVVVGLNPYVPEWMPHPRLFLEAMKAAGAEGVWMDALHLNRDQIEAMPERDKGKFSLPVMEAAKRRRPTPEEMEDYDKLHDLAGEAGIASYSMGYGRSTDFWRPYHETYANLFPTQQGLVNACYDTLKDGDILGYETWRDWFASVPEIGGMDNYIRAKASGGRLLPALLQSGELKSGMSLQEVLRLVWKTPKIGICPARQPCFSYAGKRAGKDQWEQLVDDAGLPLLVFSRAGFSEYFVDPDEVRASAA